MGNTQSCTSKGSMLLVAAANGDVGVAQELLKKYPRAALYHNFKDRTSPLIQASARGHFELVQLVLETAVMVEGVEKAKRNCIDRTNSKRQTALMVACKHGHPNCVEYLVTNGADPLLADERRHNTCLHFAALYGHSECVHKLLGSRAGYRVQQVPIAQLLCRDEDDTANMKFIDRHNGWGLTALHIAVFQGSVNTVRALLRHGASLEAVIIPSKVENSPVRCAVGSNALHIAAMIGNIVMAKLILEAQEGYPGLELRSKTDAQGLRPQEYAQRACNPVLVHLLDERLPVTLLRQIWMNYSLEQSMPPRHQTLGSMLQKLKLMFNLEIIAVRRTMLTLAQEGNGSGPGTAIVPSSTAAAATLTLPLKGKSRAVDAAAVRLQWNRRLEDVQMLLGSVTNLHTNLQALCRKEEPAAEGQHWPNGHSATHDAVLDFILSTLITPRTVSAILHAAKKLVCNSVMIDPTGDIPPGDAEAQHGMALLTTALRAVETCLHAASYLTNPAALEVSHNAPLVSASAPGAAIAAGATGDASSLAVPAHAVDAVSTDAAAAGVLPGSSISRTGDTSSENPAAEPAVAAVQPVEGAAASSVLPSPAPSTAGTGAPAAATVPASSVIPLNAHFQDSSNAAAYTSHWSAHLHTLIAQLQWDIGVQRHRRRRQHAQQQAARNAAAAALATEQAVLLPVHGTPSVASDSGPSSRSGLPTMLSMPELTAAGHRSRRTSAVNSVERSTSSLGASRAAAMVGSVEPAPAAAAASSAGTALSTTSSSPDTLPTPASAHSATAVPPAPAALLMHVSEPLLPSSPNSLTRSISCRRGDAPQEVLSCSMRSPNSAPVHPVASTARASAAEAMPGSPRLSQAQQQNDSTLRFAELMSESIRAGRQGLLSLEHDHAVSGRGGSDTMSHDHLTLAFSPSERNSHHHRHTSQSEIGLDVSELGEGVPSHTTSLTGGPLKKARQAMDAALASGDDINAAASEESSTWSEDDRSVCSICMDLPVAVLVEGCHHGLCVQCAFQLTVKGRELPSCPFCRQKIGGFEPKPAQAVTVVPSVPAALAALADTPSALIAPVLPSLAPC